MTAVVLLVPAAVVGWAWLGHTTRIDDVRLQHRVTALRLDVPDGSVVLRPGPVDQVHVHSTRSWTLRAPEVEQSWDGDTLSIRVTSPGPDLDGLAATVALEIEVPPQVSVDAQTRSASLDLAHLQGDLQLQTGSGAVTVADAQGRLRALSDSGAIQAGALASPMVDAQSHSGGVSLEFAAAPRQVSASLGSGELAVVVPPNSRYRVAGSAAGSGLRIADGLDDPASDRLITVELGNGQGKLGY
ncbi:MULTISPECIES: DUF4097 family beta strand repeat-containing protein [unclassified Kitasatospora]|uniref:DUF4097 family beta strand repeat-containing protein n=1 Tax=unclassified Kitasatospora TaxID=2633591 RepID=UPI0024747409|nr:DUF4097 family beta strand repeat-containing protein [Kitasatospora sp. MAP12-44]